MASASPSPHLVVFLPKLCIEVETENLAPSCIFFCRTAVRGVPAPENPCRGASGRVYRSRFDDISRDGA